MAHVVTLIPGDGNGPELARAVSSVIEAAGVSIRWDEQALGTDKIAPEAEASLKQTGHGLMGFHSALRRAHEPPPIVRIREDLGIHTNIRPIRTLKGIPSRHHDIDLVVVREVTEDIYAHLEHESIPGVFESLKVTTRAACERIAHMAFQYAVDNGRKKVTIVHKANIMKKSDGLFLRTAREVAAKYPSFASDDVIVDALCMKLVLKPAQFDVLVAGNLYGDIVADLCAGLAGGASNCPSVNIGPNVRVYASPHGDPLECQQPDAGNPLTLLLPALALLDDLGERPAATRIRSAVEATLGAGILPRSLGGQASCGAFTRCILERLPLAARTGIP
jgi:isocitrate dehydrogenase (NAD+)